MASFEKLIYDMEKKNIKNYKNKSKELKTYEVTVGCYCDLDMVTSITASSMEEAVIMGEEEVKDMKGREFCPHCGRKIKANKIEWD